MVTLGSEKAGELGEYPCPAPTPAPTTEPLLLLPLLLAPPLVELAAPYEGDVATFVGEYAGDEGDGPALP